jgi:opacity protein-like surface antigen
MRKIVLLCGVILALSLPAMAQDEPRAEVFGGYSYVRVNPASGVHANLNGGSGGAAFYLNRWLGVVGDFGGYKFSTLSFDSSNAFRAPSGSISADATVITYLFGPRIRFGSGGVHPFAQALFGGAHISDITSSASNCPPSGVCTPSANAFAMTVGGGVDIKVSRHFSIRGQGEYLMTRFKDAASSTGARATQNNARLSAGVVIH